MHKPCGGDGFGTNAGPEPDYKRLFSQKQSPLSDLSHLAIERSDQTQELEGRPEFTSY